MNIAVDGLFHSSVHTVLILEDLGNISLLSVVCDVCFLYSGTKLHMLLCIAEGEAPKFGSGKMAEEG